MSKEKEKITDSEHEYIDLEVNEISLVDHPANQKQFTVIKCLTTEMEEEEMANENEDQTVEKKDSTEEKKIEKVSLEENAKSKEAKEALDKITGIVEGISKKIEKLEEQNNSNSDDEEIKKSNPQREFFLSTLKEKKCSDEEIKKAMSEYDEKFPQEKVEEKKDDKEQEVKKEDDSSENILNAFSEMVEKAKTFTPKRQQVLKESIEQLSNLMKELNSSTNELPAGEGIESGIKKNSETTSDEKIMKSMQAMQDGFEKIFEITKSLNERMEKLEKIGQPSKSIEDNTTDKKVEKSDNIWSGLGLAY